MYNNLLSPLRKFTEYFHHGILLYKERYLQVMTDIFERKQDLLGKKRLEKWLNKCNLSNLSVGEGLGLNLVWHARKLAHAWDDSVSRRTLIVPFRPHPLCTEISL